MSSESTDEQTVTVRLPAELDEWLDEQAASLGLDRETVLVQLLASYRTAEQLESDGQLRIDGDGEGHSAVLGEEYLEEAVERVADDQITAATDSVRETLTARIDEVEADFQANLDDVRDRVVQVKREADQKAPEDHTHEVFDTIDGLAEEVAQLESDLESLRGQQQETADEHAADIDDLSGRLDTLEDRLQTVAWAVSDLRDAYESGHGMAAVERIKRAAAKADIERATCENCGNGVTISLLTDPKCPHCDATVSDIQPASGWFSSPKLLVAAQLESGERR
jgi:rubrerythrin